LGYRKYEKFGKALITNLSKLFKLENLGRTCYFSVGAWLSNFCYGFSNPSVQKMEYLKKARSYENRGKMAAKCKYKLAVLCLVMTA